MWLTKALLQQYPPGQHWRPNVSEACYVYQDANPHEERGGRNQSRMLETVTLGVPSQALLDVRLGADE